MSLGPQGPWAATAVARFNRGAGKQEPYNNAGGYMLAGSVVVWATGILGYVAQDIPAASIGNVTIADTSFDVQGLKDSSTFAQGAAVYYNTSTKIFTSTSSGNTFAGLCNQVAGAASGDLTVTFLAVGLSSAATLTITGGNSVAITDPGNAGAIPVTNSGYVPIVTAGAETRTLAIPSFAGEEITIAFKTKVGNCVITVASAINPTGNNTITMSAAGQAIKLAAVVTGSTLAWVVAWNSGTSLSTV